MTKKIVIGVGAALIGVLSFASLASADHTVSLAFDPGSPVTEGVEVDVNFQTNRTSGNAKLFVCHLRDADGETLPTYGSVAVCGVQNAENTPNDDGVWVELATANGINLTTHVFDTTGLGGHTVGFLVQHPPLNHAEGNALVTADLVVNALDSGSGASHAGCNGIENAFERVTNNNGAGKGKGAVALEAVAAKLGCQLD